MDKIFSKNSDFVQRDIAGECILVPIRRRLTDVNSIYVLNETGAALWHRIDGARSAQEIMTDFLQEYDTAIEPLTQDFKTLLDDLVSINAINEMTL